jgi:hypothetical protein
VSGGSLVQLDFRNQSRYVKISMAYPYKDVGVESGNFVQRAQMEGSMRQDCQVQPTS